jgi:hypothetical protein
MGESLIHDYYQIKFQQKKSKEQKKEALKESETTFNFKGKNIYQKSTKLVGI